MIIEELYEIIKSNNIETNLKNINFPLDRKLSTGIAVERSLVGILNNSDLFDKNYSIPSFFNKSFTGGYELKGKNRSLFEIDDYKEINSKSIYIEVKSGQILNSYLDNFYYSKKKVNGSKVDIKKIMHLSNKLGLNPKLFVFYNEEKVKSYKLMRRIKSQFKDKLDFIPFNFNYNEVRDYVEFHNNRVNSLLKEKYNYEFLY